MSLDLSGAENTWFYGYYGQLGSRGFFGDYDVDASSTGGLFASLNGWVGNPLQQVFVANPSTAATAAPPTQPDIANALVSGTNAATSQMLLNINPKYGNDWLTLKARYTIMRTVSFLGSRIVCGDIPGATDNVADHGQYAYRGHYSGQGSFSERLQPGVLGEPDIGVP